MQESWTFDFSPTNYPEVDLEQLVSNKEKELGIFLSYYYKKDGALAEKVRLKSGPEFESKNTGFMTLDFDLVHFNACLAINEKVREEMKISFEIDGRDQKLMVTGPYWPERGMDEI